MSIKYNIGCFPRRSWPDDHWPVYHWPGGAAKSASDDLQHSPCYIVGSYLIAEEVVSLPSLDSDWPLYKSSMPVEANDVCAIYDTTPIVDARVSKTYPNTHYGLQIIIRASDYETGKAKARAIAGILETVQNSSVEFEDYEYEIRTARPTSGVIPLGQEPETTKRRYLFTINFISTIKYMVAA